MRADIVRWAQRGIMGMLMAVGSWTAAASEDVDPFMGTWVMDRTRSHFETALPEQMVVVMIATDQGVHYRSETRLSSGARAVSEYTAIYDGQLAMVSGEKGLLAPVALRRLDPQTVEAVYLRGLRPVATSRRVVSDAGNTLTITTTFRDKDGGSHTNVAVFARSTYN